jgi:hypothetical protein
VPQSTTLYPSPSSLFSADARPSTEPPRLPDLLATPGSWGREARALTALAQARGLRLDSEHLLYSDVRDLVTLQRLLRGIETASARHLPRELRAYVCA